MQSTEIDNRRHSSIRGDAKCCFDVFHIRTGTLIIAGVQILLILGSIGYCLYNLITNPKRHCTPYGCSVVLDKLDYIYATEIVLCLIQLIIISLLIFAICQSKPKLIIPHLIIQAITLGFLVLFTVFLGLHDKVFFIILVVMTAVLQLFFIYVVWQCYKYLVSSPSQTDFRQDRSAGLPVHELQRLEDIDR